MREVIQIYSGNLQTTEKLRVAAYVRVSSRSEEQEESFAAQLRYYTQKIAQEPDWILVDIYADEGVSGLSTGKREEFNRLMADCRKGKIDSILVKSISRFARNTVDFLSSVRELKRLGVNVIFEKENINTAEAANEFLLTFFCNGAQEESMSISGNQRWAMRKRMERGELLTSSIPYGYRLEEKMLVPIPEEAAVVCEVFKKYLSGWGEAEIAADLRRRAVPTGDNTDQWRTTTVRCILKNEKYVGDARQQKTFTKDVRNKKRKINTGERDQYYVENSHTPILPREVYEKAMCLRKERTSTSEPYQTPFRKMIFCAECGSLCKCRRQNDVAYWGCAAHEHDVEACKGKRVTEESIKQAFVRMWNTLSRHRKDIVAPTINMLERIQAAQTRGNAELVRCNQQIAQLTEQNHVLAEIERQGLMDSAFFIEQRTTLDKQLAAAREEKRRLFTEDADADLMNELETLCMLLEEDDAPKQTFNESDFQRIVTRVEIGRDKKLRFHLTCGLCFTESTKGD